MPDAVGLNVVYLCACVSAAVGRNETNEGFTMQLCRVQHTAVESSDKFMGRRSHGYPKLVNQTVHLLTQIYSLKDEYRRYFKRKNMQCNSCEHRRNLENSHETLIIMAPICPFSWRGVPVYNGLSHVCGRINYRRYD